MCTVRGCIYYFWVSTVLGNHAVNIIIYSGMTIMHTALLIVADYCSGLRSGTITLLYEDCDSQLGPE